MARGNSIPQKMPDRAVQNFTTKKHIHQRPLFYIKEVIENMDFLHLYINTLLLILGRVVCAVLTATLAGYAFGRLNFRGKNLMFSLYY